MGRVLVRAIGRRGYLNDTLHYPITEQNQPRAGQPFWVEEEQIGLADYHKYPDSPSAWMERLDPETMLPLHSAQKPPEPAIVMRNVRTGREQEITNQDYLVPSVVPVVPENKIPVPLKSPLPPLNEKLMDRRGSSKPSTQVGPA